MNTRRPLARGDLVLIVFPFTDLSGQKVRPALIVGRLSGDDLIVAFVTGVASTDPRAECRLEPTDPEFSTTGLKARSLVRLNKLATLNRQLVHRRLGRIGPRTEHTVASGLRYVLHL